MHKNGVPNADQDRSKGMVKMLRKSKDFIVWIAIILTFGKYLLTRIYIISTGLSYGLRKVALSGCLVTYQATVNSNLTVLRITGSTAVPKNGQTIPELSTRSTMQLTFIRMGV